MWVRGCVSNAFGVMNVRVGAWLLYSQTHKLTYPTLRKCLSEGPLSTMVVAETDHNEGAYS